jgi:hypothetical protein
LPSGALGKIFAECLYVFAECSGHSANQPRPVVDTPYIIGYTCGNSYKRV